MKKFSDFAEEIGLSGEKIKVSEILNKEITVTDFRILTSKFNQDKDLLQLQFEINGEQRITFTNSLVLIKQCQQYKSEMPFSTIIKKISNYYTFT